MEVINLQVDHLIKPIGINGIWEFYERIKKIK